MRFRERYSVLRAVTVLAAVAALVLGAAACGSDDDGGDATAGSGSGQTSQSGGADVADITPPDGASDDEQQIYAVYDDFIEGIFGGQPERACAVMTDEIRKQFEEVGVKTRTCPAQMRFFFHPDKNPVVPDIEKLDVKGAEATALIKAGKSALYPVDFAKVEGEWKVNGGVPTKN